MTDIVSDAAPTEVPLEWLSPMVRRFVEIVGRDAALNICRTFGGTAVFLSDRLDEDSPLTKAIGIDNAKRLVRELGGGIIEIPRARSWEICLGVIEGMQSGQSAREISLKIGCTRRRVWQVRTRLRRLKKQKGQKE